MSVDVGKGVIPTGSGGNGIQIANIVDDPMVFSSERIIFASHTRQLVVLGVGFATDGTELTLSPTPRNAYDISSTESSEIILTLKEGKSWATVPEGQSVHITVEKIDTGAGEIILDDPVAVAKVESDLDDNMCDDSCEWAMD